MADILKRASERATEFRHELHMHPELPWHEVETTKKIAAKMEELGIPVIFKGFAGTECGLVAEIKGALPGPVLMVRADIDALPVTENAGLPYCSLNSGVMHACGHDAHTAILTGVAQVLKERQDEIRGTVRLLFQPAEESGTSSGAPAVIADGALDGVDAIIGEHVQSQQKAGTIGWIKGAMQASADTLDIVIRGKGGHGSSPHTAVNPILCASAVVQAITAIAPQEVSALEPIVIGIGSIHSGSARNVIPDECAISGTIRCSDMATRRATEDRIRRVVQGTASAWRCTAEVDYQCVYPVTVNDPGLTQWIIDAATAEGLGDRLLELEFMMGSEDFSYYGQKIPAAYITLGMGTDNPHHSPGFRVDDAVIPLGVRLMSALALDYGRTHAESRSA